MTLRRLASKLRHFLQPARAEQELSREIQSHIALLEDDFLSRGLTPEHARAAAKRAYGGIEQVKELHREERSFLWLEQARQDLRFSSRSLRKSPGFTLTAVVTLALGIGANSAIFSVIDSALLKAGPYKDADRIVQVIENVPAEESFTGKPFRLPAMTPQDVGQLRRSARSLSEIGSYAPGSMVLKTATGTSAVSTAQVSSQIYQILGVEPLHGRTFQEGEDRAGADHVILMSYDSWIKYFGGSPSIIGRSVVLDKTEYSVIGIMPRGFDFPDPRTEFWRPLITAESRSRQLVVFPVLARVKPDYSIAAASEEINQIFRHMRAERKANPQQRIQITPIREAQAAVSRPALLILAAAVAFVLLIACANVANLLLARSTRRQRENAIRASLGAGQGRLVRQLLVESLVLAFLGGAAGISVAFASDRVLVKLWPVTVDAAAMSTGFGDIHINGAVLLFTLALSILTGLVFGLAPSLQVWKTDYMEVMKQGIAFASSIRTRFKGYPTFGVLVVAESATTCVLLIGAGLLIHSFLKLSSVDPGFDTKNVLTFQIASAADARRNVFNEDLVQRLAALPSIQAAGYGELLPLELQSTLIRPFRLADESQALPREAAVQPRTLEGSWDYFRSVGLRLVAGRWLRASDDALGPPVMLINLALAHAFFGQANPVGKLVYSLGNSPWEIVGVVEDVRQQGLTSQPQPQFFLEYRQLLRALPEWATDDIGRAYSTRMYFAVRTSGNASDVASRVRGLVRQLDGNAAVSNVSRLQDVLSTSIAGPAFYAAMVGIFSMMAVALGAVGIFGVVTYSVTQRTQEIGIRMALGAKRKDVLLLIMRQGTAQAGYGIVLGLVAALLLTRFLRNMLFGLTALDPMSFVLALLLFAAVSAFASYWPARRATKVDPLVALRYE
jgi:putative ABC transport system permease protein